MRRKLDHLRELPHRLPTAAISASKHPTSYTANEPTAVRRPSTSQPTIAQHPLPSRLLLIFSGPLIRPCFRLAIQQLCSSPRVETHRVSGPSYLMAHRAKSATYPRRSQPADPTNGRSESSPKPTVPWRNLSTPLLAYPTPPPHPSLQSLYSATICPRRAPWLDPVSKTGHYPHAPVFSHLLRKRATRTAERWKEEGHNTK